jgi:hypothetical protein
MSKSQHLAALIRAALEEQEGVWVGEFEPLDEVTVDGHVDLTLVAGKILEAGYSWGGEKND